MKKVENMIRMKSVYYACIIVIALLCITITACSNDDNQTTSWIEGKWELTFDPDGDKTDWLIFQNDNSIVLETSDGRKISGEYIISQNDIFLTFKVNSKSVDLRLTVSDDKSKLMNNSGAYYTKL